MKRTILIVAAGVAVLVPATAGLWGNASFSQAVPVRVPASAEVVTPTVTTTSEVGDDHGGRTPRDQRTEPGDDRDDRTATPSTTTHRTPRATHSTEAGDDHGGRTPRDQRTEPGDDRDTRTGSNSGPGSDDSGSDDSGSDDSGSRHGGHGSDDSGSDDHGGHGSDD